jgi:plasmid stabilization system protein ParE
MHLRWTPEAADNLESIYRYLCEHHPSFAESTIRELFNNIRSLKDFPSLGRTGSVTGTREFVTPRSSLHHRLPHCRSGR